MVRVEPAAATIRKKSTTQAPKNSQAMPSALGTGDHRATAPNTSQKKAMRNAYEAVRYEICLIIVEDRITVVPADDAGIA
jgi:hypothetical protein